MSPFDREMMEASQAVYKKHNDAGGAYLYIIYRDERIAENKIRKKYDKPIIEYTHDEVDALINLNNSLKYDHVQLSKKSHNVDEFNKMGDEIRENAKLIRKMKKYRKGLLKTMGIGGLLSQ